MNIVVVQKERQKESRKKVFKGIIVSISPKLIYPRIEKYDKYKEIHTQRHHAENAKSQPQGENPESRKRKVSHHLQGSLNEDNSQLMRNHGDQKAVGWHIQSTDREKITRQPKNSC